MNIIINTFTVTENNSWWWWW